MPEISVQPDFDEKADTGIFSELLRDASEETGESYEDLTVNNNVPCRRNFLRI